MSQPDLVQLAREGDDSAIVSLLSAALRSPAMTIRTHCRGDCLHILLESEPVPPKSDSLRSVRQVLAQLRLTHVNIARIYGRRNGETKPAWTAEFELVNLLFQPPTVPERVDRRPDAERVAPLPSRSPRQTSTQAKPFFKFGQVNYTTADLQDLLARIDWYKAGFVVMLALYGLFGARNYTVAGALEGSDRMMGFLHGVNLIFHEAGHTIFAFFGRFLHILGGSLMQILVPAVIAGYFYVHRQHFASAIALCWTAQNFWDVSIYIKDAQERALPLLGGEAALHDWHFLLLDLRLLPYDQVIGNLVFFLGAVLYVVAIGAGFYCSQTAPKLSLD